MQRCTGDSPAHSKRLQDESSDINEKWDKDDIFHCQEGHLSNCQRWSRCMGQKRESPSTVELIKQPLRWPFRRNSYHNWTCLKSGRGDRNEREGPRGRNTSARKNVQDSASVWTAASSQKRQALWEMGTLAKGGLQRKMRLWEKRFCNNIRSFF